MKLPFLVLAAFAVSGALSLAAPLNDNFASRIELFQASSQTGTNVGATMEAGEPTPAGYVSTGASPTYSGTVWYEWTEPTGLNDWWEITTVGSSINTVLAVWSAEPASLANLQLVHVNDEASEGTVSRVRFFALADTTYYFSVAGKSSSARGNITVTVNYPTPQLVTSLNSLSLSPSSPNVTSASQNVTATINMAVSPGGSPANITSGSLKIYDPTHFLVTSTTLTTANRTSGNNFNGTYQVTFTMPRYLAPGTYLLAMRLSDVNGKSSGFGWEEWAAFPGGVTSGFTLQNTGAVDTYSQWVNQNSLTSNSGQSADFDNDGNFNLTEFASGLDPRVASSAVLVRSGSSLVSRGLPVITKVGSGVTGHLHVEFVKKQSEPSLTMTVQFSEDLVNWTDAVNSASVVASGSGYDVLAVDDQNFNPERSRRFARVKSTYVLP